MNGGSPYILAQGTNILLIPTVQLTESVIIRILISRNGTLLSDPLSSLGSYVICLEDYYMPVSTRNYLAK